MRHVASLRPDGDQRIPSAMRGSAAGGLGCAEEATGGAAAEALGEIEAALALALAAGAGRGDEPSRQDPVKPRESARKRIAGGAHRAAGLAAIRASSPRVRSTARAYRNRGAPEG